MAISLISTVTKKLLDCEYPFGWKPRSDLETFPDDMINRVVQKIEEKSAESELRFEIIMLYIVLGYEYHLNDATSDATKAFETAEVRLDSALEDDCGDLSLKRLCVPIRHIILSSKAYVLADSNELQKANDVSSKIPMIAANDTSTAAAVIGLRAVFYSEYGICGSKMGYKFATQANDMDPKESLWYFLKSKYLGRIRRVEKPFDIPTREEIQALEEAMKLEECAAYTVFTAQLYRETANRAFRFHKNNETMFPLLKNEVDKLNEQSLKLYKKSIELKPNCIHMMFRCAKGFMTLPVPYRDDKEAKRLLKKSLELAPDSGYGNHVMAQYYERREKNPELAMVHLKICEKQKVFGACMDLLRLEYRINGVDVITRLNEMLENFREPPRQCQLLSQLASYHIFATSDLPKACEYLSTCIRINSKCDDMLQHRPVTVNVYDPFNLYNVVIDEIKIQLRDKTCSREEGEKYRTLLNDLRETGIDVPTQSPQYLKKQILDKVNSFNKPRAAQSRSRVLRYPVFTKKSASSQQLSWRRPNLVMSPELIKIDTVQKINELTADWQEKLSIDQMQLNTTCKTGERVDTENDNKDEDSDAALHAQIYKETRKAAEKLKEQETSRNKHERRFEKSENWRDRKEGGKFKKVDKKQRLDVSKQTSSSESDAELNLSLRKMNLNVKHEQPRKGERASSVYDADSRKSSHHPDRASASRDEERYSNKRYESTTSKAERESKRTLSSESDDAELNLGLRKMNLNVKHEQPRKGERASSLYDADSRKSSHHPDRASASRDEERYSNKRYKSTTSKAERESKHKRASERDSAKYPERSRDRYAPDGKSLSQEREHSKSKYSARNEKVREHEGDYRHSKSIRKHCDSKYSDHYDREKSGRKYRKEDGRHLKDKSKRHSSSSEDDTKLIAKLKEVTAVFKPRTIEF